jgi:serine/threonine protein kinase
MSLFKDYNLKTDIFSLGLIIFFIFSKKIFDFKILKNIEKLDLLKKFIYFNEYIDILKNCFNYNIDDRYDIFILIKKFELILNKFNEKNNELNNIKSNINNELNDIKSNINEINNELNDEI